MGGSGVGDESAGDELSGSAGDVDEIVVDDGEFEPDGEVDADDELEERFDGLSLSVDEELDELDESEDDELESDGSASATPGMVATADPTPSATANTPTRPTKLTEPIMAPCSMGMSSVEKLTPPTISKGSKRWKMRSQSTQISLATRLRRQETHGLYLIWGYRAACTAICSTNRVRCAPPCCCISAGRLPTGIEPLIPALHRSDQQRSCRIRQCRARRR
jgi:hypothetical protein